MSLRLPPIRPFAWAGYLLNIPATFRLSSIEGDHRQGSFRLVDGERVRLEFSWATETRGRFDFPAFAKKKLGGSRKRGEPDPDSKVRELSVPGSDLQLFHLPDEEGRIDRFVGWSSKTHRVVQIVYSRAADREDEFVAGTCIPGVIDQPRDQPMKWAFFDCSFVTPSGLYYQNATLNLGDMSVRVSARGSDLRGPALTVRQLYPASLALLRRPLVDWIRSWTLETWDSYRVKRPGFLGRGAIPCDNVDSAIGPCLAVRTCLRSILRPIYWWMPRECEIRLFHDKDHDRLIVVRATGTPAEIERCMRCVLSSEMHWAGFEANG